jgi:hypothetical protein
MVASAASRRPRSRHRGSDSERVWTRNFGRLHKGPLTEWHGRNLKVRGLGGTFALEIQLSTIEYCKG